MADQNSGSAHDTNPSNVPSIQIKMETEIASFRAAAITSDKSSVGTISKSVVHKILKRCHFARVIKRLVEYGDDTTEHGDDTKTATSGTIELSKAKELTERCVQNAIAAADTDGTEERINYQTFCEKLKTLLLEVSDVEKFAIAKDRIKGQFHVVRKVLTAKALEGKVSFADIKDTLTTMSPVCLEPHIADSIIRVLASKFEISDPGPIDKFLFILFPGAETADAEEELLSRVRTKLMDKYQQDLRTAFLAMTKGADGKVITCAQLRIGIDNLELDLSEDKLDLIIRIADADGSGTIEFEEFKLIFSQSAQAIRARRTGDAGGGAWQDAARRRGGTALAAALVETPVEERVGDLVWKDPDAVAAALAAQDAADTGRLDADGLRRGLEAAGLKLSVEEIKTLIQADVGGAGGDGTVERREWVKRQLEAREAVATAESAQRTIARALIARHGSAVGAFKSLVGAGTGAGAGGAGGRDTGKLGVAALVKGLQGLGLGVPGPVLRRLVQKADTSGDGAVDYSEFARVFGPAVAPGHTGSAEEKGENGEGGGGVGGAGSRGEELDEEIRQVLKGRFDTIHTSFLSFDKDKNGTISREEMREGLMKLDLGITPAQIEQIIERADADGSGVIEYKEFKARFSTGAKAESERRLAKAASFKIKKTTARDRGREGDDDDLGAVLDAAAAAVRVEPEDTAVSTLWMGLQRFFRRSDDAFAFLKGRRAGEHADRLSESEFVTGARRLAILELAARAAGPAAAVGVVNSWRVVAAAAPPAGASGGRRAEVWVLSDARAREILELTGLLTPEEAAAAVLHGTADRAKAAARQALAAGKSVGGGGSGGGGAEDLVLGPGQASALFWSLAGAANRAAAEGGGSGGGNGEWLEQKDFVAALSRWQQRHPAAAPALAEEMEERRRNAVAAGTAGGPGAAAPAARGLTKLMEFIPGRVAVGGARPRARPSTGRAVATAAGGAAVIDVPHAALRKGGRGGLQLAGGRAHAGVQHGAEEERSEVAALDRVRERLAAIDSASRSLDARAEGLDHREAALRAEEVRLNRRAEDLDRRERELDAAREAVDSRRRAAEALRAEVERRLAEAEERAAWLAEKRAAVAAREVRLREESARIAAIQRRGIDGLAGAAAAAAAAVLRAVSPQASRVSVDAAGAGGAGGAGKAGSRNRRGSASSEVGSVTVAARRGGAEAAASGLDAVAAVLTEERAAVHERVRVAQVAAAGGVVAATGASEAMATAR